MDLVLPFGIAFKDDTDLSHKVAAYNFFLLKTHKNSILLMANFSKEPGMLYTEILEIMQNLWMTEIVE